MNIEIPSTVPPLAITRHHDANPNENPWVNGVPLKEEIEVVAYSPVWPDVFQGLAESIKGVLGDRVLRLDHVGSTAVPGLAGKPVIDIDLIVRDPAEESAYVESLGSIGYVLVIREPSWHKHRCLRLEEPRVNLHVFGPDCPENIRHLLFRDWLREHPDDCALYVRAKRSASECASFVADYNLRKQAVIREIYARVFREAGLL